MDKNKDIPRVEKEIINDLPKMNVGNMLLFKSKESSID